jgi:hypothetical protein
LEAARTAREVYSAPARAYNGYPPARNRKTDFPERRFKPRGIFTFFQLNMLLEGLFNDALTPNTGELRFAQVRCPTDR